MDEKQRRMAMAVLCARSAPIFRSHETSFFDGWAACLEANGIISDKPPKARTIGEMDREHKERMRRYAEELDRRDCTCGIAHDGPCDSSRIGNPDSEGNKRVTLEMKGREVPGAKKADAAIGHFPFFLIGESVEFKGSGGLWYSGHVALSSDKGFPVPNNVEVRRKPAWTPKEGEAVLYKGPHGFARPGIATSQHTIAEHDGDWWPGVPMKPYDPEKAGRPWGEI